MHTPIHWCPVESFPGHIQHIPKPPKKLSYRGKLPPENYRYVTIVGSRNHSPYAQRVIENIIKEISKFPIVIVSGLAYGIDACVHRAALQNNMITMAFPGSGLDSHVLYPQKHHVLANEILDAGGCLVSEFKESQKAYPWTFPVRNRLMAGISDLVIIVEAREKSGSLITAREALDYGRSVMVIPGHIYDDYCSGSNQLIRDGAPPLLCGADLLYELGFSPDSGASSTRTTYEHLSDYERNIMDHLYEPKTRGDLIRSLDISIDEANQILSMMELQEYIYEKSGIIYKR